MKKSNRVITRRDFLRTSSYMAMGSLITLPLVGRAADTQNDKSRVVLIRDRAIMDGSGALRSGNLAEMMDEAMATLTGVPAGAEDKQGRFPKGTVNYRVRKRLLGLSRLHQQFEKAGKGEKDGKPKA